MGFPSPVDSSSGDAQSLWDATVEAGAENSSAEVVLGVGCWIPEFQEY